MMTLKHQRLGLAIALGLCLSVNAFAEVEGAWSGTLNAAGQELAVVFNIEEGNGAYTATLDVPAQGAKGLAFDKVEIADKSVKLEISQLGMSYTGTLSDDGKSMEGTYSQSGLEVPLRLELAAGFPDHPLPHDATLRRWFRVAGLTPPPRPPQSPDPPRATVPHQRWQLDATEQVRLADGTRVSWLTASEEATGALLWETTLPFSGNATPITYEIDGRQYVAIAAGGGKGGARNDPGSASGGTYVAFALPR